MMCGAETQRRPFVTGTEAAAILRADTARVLDEVSEADGDLVRAYNRFDRSFDLAERIENMANAISDAVDRDFPAAMHVRDEDHELLLVSLASIDPVRGCAVYAATVHVEEGIEHLSAVRVPTDFERRQLARMNEILSAAEAFHEEKTRTLSALGFEAIEKAELAAMAANRPDRIALAETPASSLAGVMLKVRAVYALERGTDGVLAWMQEQCDPPGCAEHIAISAILDLMRIAGLMPAAEVQA